MRIAETKPFMRSAAIMFRTLTFLLAIVGCAGVAVLFCLGFAPGSLSSWTPQFNRVNGPLRAWQHVALGGILLSHIALWLALLWHARSIFGSLLQSDGVAASRFARRAAWVLWAMLIWSIVAYALSSVISTWHHPAGQRSLAISIGSAQIMTLLAAMLASFTAHAFALGTALWKDSREII